MGVDAPRQWTVAASEAGTRLDLFLGGRLGLGRVPVRRLLEAGRVRLDGRAAGRGDKGRLLAAGATVAVTEAGTEALVAQPELPLPILGQGAGWIILDKRAGQPVHPLIPGERGTLLNALAGRYPQIAAVGEGGLRGGVVHRLDVETSGAVLFATEPAAWEAFRGGFVRHETLKIYNALVAGHPPGTGERRMHLHIARHRPARVRVAPPDRHPLPPGARLCDLNWRVLDSYPSASLVEIRLGTGFLHQIRAMFAEMGHPVLGDGVYGSGPSDIAPRQMLHARQLRVNQAEGVSPLPEDFQRAVERCRSGEGG